MRRIFVESEFAPLRTVVLAQCQVRLPDKDAIAPGQLAAELAVLPPEQREPMLALLGKDLAQANPQLYERWEAERDAFGALLERHGVEVFRPRLLTPYEKEAGGKHGYSNHFVRDPWFTIGSFVIEGSLRFLHRRREVLPSRDIFDAEVYFNDCTYVATPQPEIMPLDVDNGGEGPFLEGGDVLVCGNQVFVGVSGRASTMLGARWLQKLLEPHGYGVEQVRLAPDVLHLDCALSLVRQGLLVACDEVLPDGLPDVLLDWEKIPATKAEALSLGTNGLPLSPEVYVTDPAFARIGGEIANRGVKVEYLDFSISRSFGGAFRCSTQPLHRES